VDQQTKNRNDGNDNRRLVVQLQQTRLPDGRNLTTAYGLPANTVGSPHTIEGPEDSLAVMRDLIAPAIGKRDFLGCMEEEVETDGTFRRLKRSVRIEAEGSEFPVSVRAAGLGTAQIVATVGLMFLVALAACGLMHLMKG
jgi:hypothetical protein